jgi:predicted adenylyl cyclase CyaB
MQNVEFKAELRDPQLARIICKHVGAQHLMKFAQKDTYYKVPSGRLKKREQDNEPIEYILYHRHDRVRPKLSHFTIYSEEQALERFGEREMPVLVVVEKIRDLWMYKNVRVHLDEVQDLGLFIECEALVSPKQHLGRCHRRIAKLRKKFGPAMGEMIACGYAELLLNDEALSV